MNFKTMEIDTLKRILEQVSSEVNNRRCRDAAAKFQASLANTCSELKRIQDDLDTEPRHVNDAKCVAPCLEDLQMAIDMYWDRLC